MKAALLAVCLGSAESRWGVDKVSSGLCFGARESEECALTLARMERVCIPLRCIALRCGTTKPARRGGAWPAPRRELRDAGAVLHCNLHRRRTVSKTAALPTAGRRAGVCQRLERAAAGFLRAGSGRRGVLSQRAWVAQMRRGKLDTRWLGWAGRGHCGSESSRVKVGPRPSKKFLLTPDCAQAREGEGKNTKSLRNSSGSDRRRGGRGPARAAAAAPPGNDSYLVDPASSHMLVSKIKPCMS